MKARKKFFTMFLSMLLVFTMMPLSAIPVTAADSTDPPPAALDQTKPVDETLTETDIQTETESTTTPEPDPGITATGRMTVSQPTMTAAATGDAHLLVIMEDGTKIKLFPGKAIYRNNSNGATDPISGTFYVAELQRTDQDQYTSYGKWTLILKSFHGQSITYVKGSGGATGQYIDIKLYGDSVLTAGAGSVTDYQKNYRGLSCGSATEGNEPTGSAIGFRIQSAYDDSDASLTIHADYKTARFMNYAQGIFTSDLCIGKRATVRIDVAVPERNDSSAIHAGNVYLKDNSSLDIKCSNAEQAVRVYSSGHGTHHLDIDTAGSVNIRMQNQDRLSYSRAFEGLPGATNSFHMNRVGYMRIVTEGLYNSSAAGEKYDFDIYPDWDSVNEGLTKVNFEGNGFHQIQYIPGAPADAVQLYVCDGRIKDGRYTFYNRLYRALTNGTADITITAPESNIPFKKWVALSANSSTEESSISYLATGSKSTDETVTLHFDGPGTRRILAKYDPFTTQPICTYDYSPVANCPTGKISWAAGYGLENATGRLIEEYYTLSSDGPTPATDASGNPIDKVTSGVSVFAQQAGSGINYALSSGKWYRIALQDGSGRWHISDSFRINYPTVVAPPAPELVSLKCSGAQTTLSPNATDCYLFARGLIVKATNFDYDKYEMYYTFNNGGTDPGDPTGTSPSTSSGVIVLKNSETWTGVTNLRVRFKSKATGAWSPTTKVPLQKVIESQNQLYEVAFAPAENYTQSVGTLTITGPITATVTKKNLDKWPINAELVYSTHPKIAMARFFEPYTGAVSIDDAGAFRVGVRVPDPKSSSDDYSVIRDENFTIKLAPTYTKYTLTVVNGRAYQANGSEFSTNSTGSSRTYNINGNVLVEIRANQPASGKVFEKWTGSNVGVADPYSPTTTLTMPTHNATVTAEISGAPLITGETRLKMTPESGPVEALSFFHKNFGSRRMLTYDWYEGSEKLGPDADFEPGKCYTAQVEVKPVPGARFDGPGKVSMGLNHALSTQDIPFTRVSDKLLRTEIRLLFKPVLTMELHPGDTLPTAAELTDQLPEGYTVQTLTWADNATTAPSGATEMTIAELKIGGTATNYHVAGGAVVIDGTAYTASNSYFNTVTLTNVKVPVKAKGVEVRGTVKSYGSDSDTITVQLIEAGLTEPAYEAIVFGNNATYSFATVPAGTYTLKVMKKGHAPFTKEITIGDSNVTENVTIYLIGDVNGDGVINGQDLQRLYEHIKGENPLSVEALPLGDVNGDGAVNGQDLQRLYEHIKGENLLT
ncbi:MAG: dockerin type I domain-containing protein [Gemmiger formicilis]|uniref:dockerin type I domain-containing protein n=1 Tax=Gemmiger formicilis TaxID=745368 RepID=UPI003993E837